MSVSLIDSFSDHEDTLSELNSLNFAVFGNSKDRE